MLSDIKIIILHNNLGNAVIMRFPGLFVFAVKMIGQNMIPSSVEKQ